LLRVFTVTAWDVIVPACSSSLHAHTCFGASLQRHIHVAPPAHAGPGAWADVGLGGLPVLHTPLRSPLRWPWEIRFNIPKVHSDQVQPPGSASYGACALPAEAPGWPCVACKPVLVSCRWGYLYSTRCVAPGLGSSLRCWLVRRACKISVQPAAAFLLCLRHVGTYTKRGGGNYQLAPWDGQRDGRTY
jgi:hypothetical protein